MLKIDVGESDILGLSSEGRVRADTSAVRASMRGPPEAHCAHCKNNPYSVQWKTMNAIVSRL